MSATIRIKVNGVPGHVPGSVITVPADSHGTPLDEYWRRRLKDAKTDGCCEVVVAQPKPPISSRKKTATVKRSEK